MLSGSPFDRRVEEQGVPGVIHLRSYGVKFLNCCEVEGSEPAIMTCETQRDRIEAETLEICMVPGRRRGLAAGNHTIRRCGCLIDGGHRSEF